MLKVYWRTQRTIVMLLVKVTIVSFPLEGETYTHRDSLVVSYLWAVFCFVSNGVTIRLISRQTLWHSSGRLNWYHQANACSMGNALTTVLLSRMTFGLITLWFWLITVLFWLITLVLVECLKILMDHQLALLLKSS